MTRLANAARHIVRNYHIYRWANPSSMHHSEYAGISAGWGYCISFDHSRNRINLFSDKKSWLAKFLPASMQSKGCSIKLEEDENIKDVSCGRNHFLILSASGKVYSCGSNSLGQCGWGSSHSDSALLTPINQLSRVSKVCCGLDHSLILTEEGQVFSFGWSTDGQTGTGATSCVTNPTLVDLNNQPVQSIHTVADSSFAITDEKRIFVWGNNEYGQLGLSPEQHGNKPQIYTPVKSYFGQHTIAFAVGGSFSAYLKEDGDLFYCGYGLRADEIVDKNSIQYLAKPRHLYSVPKQDLANVSLQAGLHYLTLITNNEVLIWGSMDGFPHATGRKIQIDDGTISIHSGTDELYIVSKEN